tara:strand:- start:296 stop:703 length:408 start_codon:yes stop_codon:yes gene_type:complete
MKFISKTNKRKPCCRPTNIETITQAFLQILDTYGTKKQNSIAKTISIPRPPPPPTTIPKPPKPPKQSSKKVSSKKIVFKQNETYPEQLNRYTKIRNRYPDLFNNIPLVKMAKINKHLPKGKSVTKSLIKSAIKKI